MDNMESCARHQFGEEDLKRLLSYYLECIEEEDLRSLTLRISQRARSFLSPWDETEPLFHGNNIEVDLEAQNEADRAFLLRGLVEAGNPQRLFYGYPVYLDGNDCLSPLFFKEVEVRQIEGERFRLWATDPEGIQFNHHFLRKRRAELEEIQKVQDHLEGPFGSFFARLREAFEYFGLTVPEQIGGAVDRFPSVESPREIWYYRPILFKSERSGYTSNLRRELETLRRYPRFFKKARGTAINLLLSPPLAYGRLEAEKPSREPLVEIRPLNTWQEAALKSGMTAPLTVVTGPPGTGKSQIVANLLANAVLQGKKVLFASKNNKAVDVIRDWLREILGEREDWTFRVGNHSRMEKLENEMISRLEELGVREQVAPPNSKEQALLALDREVESVRAKVTATSRRLKDLAMAASEWRAVEALIPAAWVVATANSTDVTSDLVKLERLKRETETIARGEGFGFGLWLKKLLFGTRLIDKYFRELREHARGLQGDVRSAVEKLPEHGLNWSNMAALYDKVFTYYVWLRLGARTAKLLEDVLQSEQGDALLGEMTRLKEAKASLSRDILRDYWTSTIAPDQPNLHHLVRTYFELAKRLPQVTGRSAWLALKDKFETVCGRLLAVFPVWIVTSLSARRALPLTDNIFDLLIIDEASQCDIASALPLLFRAKRVLVIGDPQQLRYICALRPQQDVEIADRLQATYLLADLSYASKSLYDLAAASIVCSGGKPIFLAEHYRSHPDIVEFSNRTFYAHSLILRTRVPELAERLGELDIGLFWHNVRGEVVRSAWSARNEVEAERIVATISDWIEGGFLDRQDLTVGVVSPFRLQVERIKHLLTDQPWFEKARQRIRVGTAHTFQGDEADIILFSPVVAAGIHPQKARWVADTRELLNVAITRARGAFHVFGDAEACQRTGGFLGKFAQYAIRSAENAITREPHLVESERRMEELIGESGLWHRAQFPENPYTLDFLVVSPFGTRYDIEIDGKKAHLTAEQLAYDELRDKVIAERGYTILRINASEVLNYAEKVLGFLKRLV